MKINDRVPVQIEGINVAEAIVEDFDEDGNAVLVIPATRLVVAVRSSLDLNATKEPEVDRVFAGLETPGDETSPATDDANLNPIPVRQVQYNAPGSEVGEGIHGKELDSSILD